MQNNTGRMRRWRKDWEGLVGRLGALDAFWAPVVSVQRWCMAWIGRAHALPAVAVQGPALDVAGAFCGSAGLHNEQEFGHVWWAAPKNKRSLAVRRRRWASQAPKRRERFKVCDGCGNFVMHHVLCPFCFDFNNNLKKKGGRDPKRELDVEVWNPHEEKTN